MADNIINRLSELTANQIAAGEVVQRPSSVVKELMENAIDAGATVVIVGIREGGRDQIQVIDDGCGMSYDDAVAAFERHATSKIRESDDLYRLSTFGFRGEALPSIASVAEVELRTMRGCDELGTIVTYNGGELTSHSQTVCRVGTQLMIKNLFYNVPARRKFLKTAETETQSVLSEFKKIALCYPHVSFMMHSNDRCVYSLPIANLRTRVSEFVGVKRNKDLIELYTDSPIVEVKGYVGRPGGATKRPEQYLFINGRYFRSPVFNRAIISAYENLLPSSDVAPQYFLYLKCDPSEVDVNVHPSKIEVKFENEAEMATIIKAAVRATLGRNGIMPMIDFDGSSGIDIPIFGNSGVLMRGDNTNRVYNPYDESFSFTDALFGDNTNANPDTGKDLDEEYMARELTASTIISSSFEREESTVISSSFEREESFSSTVVLTDDSFAAESEFNSSVDILSGDETTGGETTGGVRLTFDDFLRNDEFAVKDLDDETEEGELFSVTANPQPIGETTLLDDKYILTTIGNDIYIVDIKRAMSRIMYDRYCESISEATTQPSHRLIFPTTISLQMVDKVLIDDCRNDLLGMGFIIEDSEQEGSIDIVGVPIDMGDTDPYQLFEDILESMRTDDNFGYNKDKRERLIMTLSTIATNKKYSSTAKEDLKFIVETLRKSENFSYSPLGKATTVKIGLKEIKKLLE